MVQCDQIGRYLKALGQKFSAKSIPEMLFGLIWKAYVFMQNFFDIKLHVDGNDS